MTPALALLLLKQPDAMRWDSFYTFAMTGSSLADGLIDTINGLIGRPAAVNGYGLTEASGRVFYGAVNAPGSLGVPLPSTQIKLVDHHTGEEVQGGAPGELWIKGPQICRVGIDGGRLGNESPPNQRTSKQYILERICITSRAVDSITSRAVDSITSRAVDSTQISAYFEVVSAATTY
ncbi:Long-chain-fatty-acid--CoA ligase [Eumeta japonica]|uniref:Long-chain-fatty-acid--CoA ligase n=1 Tax=Eumeta variegata TaxID=151549 RepID=A0A4C1Y981_EUMVA|nr:Long-chain-fatty-acid--CoA ligase [Eumeta japonica]